MDAFCVKTLGSRVAVHECFDASVASVHGVRLIDGRRITVKARRGGKSTAGVAAAQTAQRHLSTSGFPCPTPLVGPTPLGAGVATVETTLEAGQRGDPHEPELRRAMAVTLVRLVELCRPLRLEGLEAGSELPGGLCQPRDARFDFERTSWVPSGSTRSPSGPEDALSTARRWSSGIATGAPRTSDSLQPKSLPCTTGTASGCCPSRSWPAAPHTISPAISASRVDGSFPQSRRHFAFIDDYETVTGARVQSAERQTARAALVNAMAYTARCEHSDALTGLGGRPPEPPGAFPDGSARAFLIRHSEELLSPAPPS